MSLWFASPDYSLPIWRAEDHDTALLEGRDTAHLDTVASCSSCGTVCTRGWAMDCDFCGYPLESFRLRLVVAETKPPPDFKGQLVPAVPGSQAELWHQERQRENETRERQWQVKCQLQREHYDDWRRRLRASSERGQARHEPGRPVEGEPQKLHLHWLLGSPLISSNG